MNPTLPAKSLVASIVVASLTALLIGCDEGPGQPPDTKPSFGTERIQDQALTVGAAIAPLVLPAATGGNAPLTYSLTPNVSSIRFDPTTRTVSGTPTAAGDHAMTYRVVDDDGDAASLTFSIRITAPARPQPSAPTIGEVRDGAYLNAVLNGDYANPLTIAGAAAIDAALTDAEVLVALAADWSTPFDELVSDTPEVLAMLQALASVYDSEFAPESVSIDLLQTASDRRLQPALLRTILISASQVLNVINAISLSDLVDCTFAAVRGALDEDPSGDIPEAIAGCLRSAIEESPLLDVAARLASLDQEAGPEEVLAATGLTALSRLVERVKQALTELFEQEPPADTAPSFGANRVQDQAYAVGTATTPLVLPGASGGDAPLTYSLRPDIPGLQFNARTRTLSGTPTLAAAGGVYSMTYRVVDGDGDEATLTFTVRVTASDEETKPAAQLTRAITFTGGTVKDGRPPAPTNQPGDPELSGAPTTASTIAPGDEGSMSIGFSNVPANTPFDVNIRFAGADQYINIPIDPTVTGGNTSGTLDLPFSLPASVCDDLGDIQHQIACYESVSVGGVSVSLEQARQIVLDCGRRQYCDSAGADLAGEDLSNLNLQDCTFAGANLSGANLREANLSGADLSNADLSSARLSGADLSNANLRGTDLSWADLSDFNSLGLPAAILSGIDLSNADLSNADLSGADLTTVANLRGATMHNTDFYRANLASVNLSGEDLYHADFPGADLSNANLSGADLSWADLSDYGDLAATILTGTDLSNTDLSNADLSGADLTTVANLRGATMHNTDFYRANLASVNLSGGDLYHADFPGADLSNANLSGANLSWADLSDYGDLLAATILTGTDLSNTDLSNADLSGADLTTVANLRGATMHNTDFYRANLASVNLSGEDLYHADFPGADLSNTNLSGADLSWADLSDYGDLAAAILSGTDLSNAYLQSADLGGVDLSTANLTGVRGCPWRIPLGYEGRFDDCG